MVSRKKAKGKARKAKKEEDKDAHDDSSAAAAQQRQREQEQEGALEAQLQMQRLLIDSPPSPCQHGFDPFPEGDVRCRVVRLYLETFNSGVGIKDRNKIDAILKAMDAVDKKYPEVLYDSSKMKHILSYFLSGGTDHILNGRDGAARTTVAVIIMFEEFIAFSVQKTQAVLHLQKLMEMLIADDHTLVSFFRKRITCSCLDKKHKEVKSIKKMGYCNNEKCPLPDGKVERSKMLYCTRCRYAYYCSRDCQETHWSDHREVCKKKAEENAKFEQEMRIRDQNSM
mmetsp:Transcript_31473/g.53277  ORF Transcript_31473/g.53277 Transcript_31473/m.53277 type:complete len:283 (-) Transcript_31473:99-947(-)